jgi:hypothetical protein
MINGHEYMVFASASRLSTSKNNMSPLREKKSVIMKLSKNEESIGNNDGTWE